MSFTQGRCVAKPEDMRLVAELLEGLDSFARRAFSKSLRQEATPRGLTEAWALKNGVYVEQGLPEHPSLTLQARKKAWSQGMLRTSGRRPTRARNAWLRIIWNWPMRAKRRLMKSKGADTTPASLLAPETGQAVQGLGRSGVHAKC